MKTRTALTIALVLSGKFDIPGKTMLIRGRDQFGSPIEETIPSIDNAKLNAALDKLIPRDA